METLGNLFIFLLNEITPDSGKKKLKKDDSDPKYDVLLSRRQFAGLDKDTQDLVNLVTTRKGVEPTGSFKWKVHKYPSDIDIMEIVKACCSPVTASQKIAKRFQEMAKRVKNEPGMFLGDFKAGLDKRYEMDIGEIDDNNKVVGLDKKKATARYKTLKETKLISNEEYKKAIELLKGKVTDKDWEELNDITRKYYVLRWNLDELIQGYKMLPQNKKMTLAEALRFKSIVKIDVWSKVDGNYNETTNYFFIVAKDKKGNETILNKELEDYVKSINKDIVHYNSPLHKNTLKVIKRIWNKAVWIKDRDTMEKVFPIFSSDAARLNNINGEIEIINLMLEKLSNDKLPKDDLREQIDGFKRRINDTSDFKIQKEKYLYKLIDKTTELFDKNKTLSDKQKETIIKNLEKLVKELKKEIEIYANWYADKIGLNVNDYLKDIQTKEEKKLFKILKRKSHLLETLDNWKGVKGRTERKDQ